MSEPNVIRQRTWTKAELRTAGFRYYDRRKELVLARELPESEAPKTIETSWDTLIAEAGNMICYKPSYRAQPSIDDYDHWPVRRDLFDATYTRWDEPDRTTTPGEMHLLMNGCEPYFKHAGAWAKKLDEETAFQSLESPHPVTLPAGAYLLIGTKGEPWSADEKAFNMRYVLAEGDDHAFIPTMDEPAAAGA